MKSTRLSGFVLACSAVFVLSANATGVIQPVTTLFERADFNSDQYQVQQDDHLIVTSEEEGEFTKAVLLSSNGDVVLAGYVSSAKRKKTRSHNKHSRRRRFCPNLIGGGGFLTPGAKCPPVRNEKELNIE